MRKNILLLAAGLLLAQSVAAKDYIVELIVFRHTTSSEGVSWQPGVMLPLQPAGLAVFGSAARNADYQAMETGPALAEMALQLARSRSHPLVAYRTWQQPGLPRGQAAPIRFNLGPRIDTWDTGEQAPRAQAQHGVGDDYQDYTLATLNPGFGGAQRRTYQINGTVTVALGRYLHLYTDLIYTDVDSGNSTLQKAHRRMRSKRSHYIDNPAFGIIAHITPVDEPEPEPVPEPEPDNAETGGASS